jgi:hypothetical protein
MTNRYGVLHEGKRIAIAYCSPHPDFSGHLVVSVIPLERKGKWEDSNLRIHLEKPIHDIFPDTKPELEAVTEVVAQAAIEPFKVTIQTLDEWYSAALKKT